MGTSSRRRNSWLDQHGFAEGAGKLDQPRKSLNAATVATQTNEPLYYVK